VDKTTFGNNELLENSSQKLLRGLSLVLGILFYYPVIVLIRKFVFKEDGFILGILLLFFCIYIGNLSSRTFGKKKVFGKKRIVPLLLVVVPALICLIIFYSYEYTRIIYETFVASLFYISSSISYYKDKFSRVRSNVLVRVTIIGIVSLLFCVFIKDFKYLKVYFEVIMFVELFFVLLLLNQKGVEEFVLKKSLSDQLPENIRSFNFVLVVLVFGLILILSNIRFVAVEFSNLLLFLSVKIVGLVFTIIKWLSSNQVLPKNMGKIPNSVNLTKSGQVDMTYKIVGWLTAIIFLIIFVRLIPVFIRVLPKVFSSLFKIFQGAFSIKSYNDTSEYTDINMSIKPKNKKQVTKLSKSIIKDLKKKLKTIKDPVLIVRYNYLIVLCELISKGIHIKESDTSWQIAAKSEAIGGIKECFSQITACYNDVRYGQSFLDEEGITMIKEKYNTLIKILNEK
jgi:hypothetical protein